ncbi:MAG: hypothetical protein WBG90_09315 [Saonia sp.]
MDDRNRISKESRIIYDKVSNEIFKIPNINILDREKTQILLNEFEFQSSGLVDERFIRKLGQFYGSGLILVGRILRNDFKSESLTSSGMFHSCKTQRYNKGTYFLSFSFKLIDLNTTKIVYSKTVDIEEVETTERVCSSPSRINREKVYSKALESFGQSFYNLLSDHEISYKVKFQTHRKYNDQLKQAITYMKIGDGLKAYNLLRLITETQTNDKALSSALYNLAIVQLHTSDELKALENAKKGYLLNPKNDDCLDIIRLLN